MVYTNHIKEYRVKMGLSQQEFGNIIGVSRQSVSQIERGTYSPSVDIALKMAEVFGATVEELFKDQNRVAEKKTEETVSRENNENLFDGEFEGNTLHPFFTKIDFK